MTNPTFIELLDELQQATYMKAYWTDHGKRNDGRLEHAITRCKVARAALIKYDKSR